MKIAIINGPNLNLLGRREPHIYGHTTLGQIESGLSEVAKELDVELECSQHNGEGELISAIHALTDSADGIVINAGAYTHTSLAIRDALVGVNLPYVELHLTNIYAREEHRRRSMLAEDALAVVCGFGAYGYELALRGLVSTLRNRG
ncbi:MAG: type II 3-dehydroquinate dehydratase [Gemmatimonadaceae bacterium]|nr:type II 3-dehydroquinate dehydratase [Gemmatimonadaceae bacterium]